eukprot:1337721-Amphidinium_carterae.3
MEKSLQRGWQMELKVNVCARQLNFVHDHCTIHHDLGWSQSGLEGHVSLAQEAMFFSGNN